MKKKLSSSTFTLLTLCALLALIAIFSCSNQADIETQVSGKWQRTTGDGIVDINLAGNPKTLVFDGQSYNAVIEKVDQGTNTVQVKVQTPSGESEVWSISQKWNDNGSSFKLAFRHNGTTETLVPAGQS